MVNRGFTVKLWLWLYVERLRRSFITLKRIVINQNSPLLFSVRFRLCLLLSAGFALVYALRYCLIMGALAHARHPTCNLGK